MAKKKYKMENQMTEEKEILVEEEQVVEPVAAPEPIKAVEPEKKPEPIKKAEPVAPQPKKYSFQTWWALREKQIPSMHSKEIVLADFKARKVPKEATLAEFDKALALYGVKL